jgi:hypothetical protein
MSLIKRRRCRIYRRQRVLPQILAPQLLTGGHRVPIGNCRRRSSLSSCLVGIFTWFASMIFVPFLCAPRDAIWRRSQPTSDCAGVIGTPAHRPAFVATIFIFSDMGLRPWRPRRAQKAARRGSLHEVAASTVFFAFSRPRTGPHRWFFSTSGIRACVNIPGRRWH